jgi:hypothetical protein
MAKEKSKENRLKRLEQQYYRMDGNERKQANILGRITTLKNTK